MHQVTIFASIPQTLATIIDASTTPGPATSTDPSSDLRQHLQHVGSFTDHGTGWR
jgi:hypothetical protein